MGKPWSEERHYKLAVKRMNEVKSGRAGTRFFSGPVAVFKNKGIEYYFSVSFNFVELSAYAKGGQLFRLRGKGRKLENFAEKIADWLRFPRGFVIYRKRGKARA